MSSTAGLPRSRRQRSAYAIKAAAKARRQRNFAIVGAIIFVIVAAYEVPHTIHLLTKSNNPPAPTAVAPPATEPKPKPTHLKLSGSPTDPFAQRTFAGSDSAVGATLPGRDPFQLPGASSAPTVTPTPITPSQPLPQTIVIGSPGAGRVAVHGWIVILASIPTGQGRGAAEAFARSAKGRVGSVSILNSSNRRPLRGGYWVVYTGPYSTLGAVSSRAGEVHASGYGTAYIRQLIIYR